MDTPSSVSDTEFCPELIATLDDMTQETKVNIISSLILNLDERSYNIMTDKILAGNKNLAFVPTEFASRKLLGDLNESLVRRAMDSIVFSYVLINRMTDTYYYRFNKSSVTYLPLSINVESNREVVNFGFSRYHHFNAVVNRAVRNYKRISEFLFLCAVSFLESFEKEFSTCKGKTIVLKMADFVHSRDVFPLWRDYHGCQVHYNDWNIHFDFVTRDLEWDSTLIVNRDTYPTIIHADMLRFSEVELHLETLRGNKFYVTTSKTVIPVSNIAIGVKIYPGYFVNKKVLKKLLDLNGVETICFFSNLLNQAEDCGIKIHNKTVVFLIGGLFDVCSKDARYEFNYISKKIYACDDIVYGFDTERSFAF